MSERLRLLHIEDLSSDAALIQRVFDKAGLPISSERIEDPDQLRAALSQQPWDAIICDYSLPQLDAPTALQVLQETGLDIPFIVVSGAIGEDVAVGMMKRGAHDYLMKDNLARLPAVVEREVADAHLRFEQRKTQAALRRKEALLRGLESQAQLIKLSPDAIIVADSNGKIRAWNLGAEQTYGWTASQAVGSIVQSLLRTTFTVPVEEIEQFLLRDGQWEGELEHVSHSGQRVIVDSRQALLKDEDGHTIGIIQINRDITQRLANEAKLRQTILERESALEEKTVLLQEVHHRVKNSLAVISSLLSLQAAMTENAAAQTALKESQDRVYSMALIHEHLYGSDHLDRVEFSDYVRRLLDELFRSILGAPERIAIEMSLESVQLGIEQAVPCALILNELISNAFKYAFPDGRRGRIAVSFRRSGAGDLELVVEDDGVGFPAGQMKNPQFRSLGLRIVNILTRQLGGSIEQRDAEGTCVVLRFPAVEGCEPGPDSAAVSLSAGSLDG